MSESKVRPLGHTNHMNSEFKKAINDSAPLSATHSLIEVLPQEKGASLLYDSLCPQITWQSRPVHLL